MTTGSRLKARYEAHFQAYQQGGLGALDEAAREELGFLLIHEARRGSFSLDHPSDEALVAAFISHLRSQYQYGDAQDVKIVLDYSRDLRAQARELTAAGQVVSPIILYATWVEHWLNGILLTRSLARKVPYAQAQSLLREASARAKYSWIWTLLELPPLSLEDLLRLQRLSDTRNQYVHYKWPFQPPEAVETPDARLQAILEEAEPLCRRLVDYDLDHISSPALPVAERVFGIALRDFLREQ
jgi:hypothetical protein